MIPHNEGAVILTKPACVYAYEANLDDMNRKRLKAWRDRKGQEMESPFTTPSSFSEVLHKRGMNTFKLASAREFMAENNIKVRTW